ncbi:MAG: undecaprenyldiphospho-muramoylpentapeptide beta-N-acetylglucosaminyltransferase [Candidatus Aminicenantales bacterium]
MNKKRVIISGGGTAGHLYPGLAVGQKLKEKNPHLELVYVGSSRGLEKKIMNHYKVDFIPMKIEGLKGKGLKIVKSLFLLPLSLLKSLVMLRRLKPNLVIGVGGYSSGPIVLLASWLRIPTLILEQNLKPGFTNRLLIPWARKAVVAFKESLPAFKGKGIFIGNPVREEFYKLQPKEKNSTKLTILIFGGSQGSHFLNKAVVEALPYLSKVKENLIILHQTGKNDLNWVKKSYLQHGFKEVAVAPYFYDIDRYFQKSDLIISRAGATTIAELIASRKASLLIPFSKATDNHQVLNARYLEKMKAAEVMVEEELRPQLLAEKIIDFLRNRAKISQMEKNLEALRTDNVTEKIACLCLEMMEAG